MSPSKFILHACTLFILSFSQLSLAHSWHSQRADSHAPIGVMGDHIHKPGEWMLSYRFMTMDMQGNRRGSNRVATADVLENYPVAPLKMRTDMHMFGIMYAPTHKLTLMGMLPYIEKEMDHITRSGVSFTTQSQGIGDASISGLYSVYSGAQHKVHLNLGLRLATGDTDKRDRTPAGANQKLPYPMQLGSGTYDVDLGVTHAYQATHWSGGNQLRYTSRAGSNDENYRLGDEYQISTWFAKLLSEQLSLSARLTHHHWNDIKGADPELNPAVIATADPNLRAGERTSFGIGFNYLALVNNRLKGHRLALEYLTPIHQSLDGPQLELDASLTLGWQYAFN